MMESGRSGDATNGVDAFAWQPPEAPSQAGDASSEITSPVTGAYDGSEEVFEVPVASEQERTPVTHLDALLSAEIREVTTSVPLLPNSARLDYAGAPVAYKVDTILLHAPATAEGAEPPITADTEILLARHATENEASGAWAGVSSYVNSTIILENPNCDPVAETAFDMLYEEAGVGFNELPRVDLFLGDRFAEPRENDGILHVVPLVGRWTSAEKPRIEVSVGTELSDAKWVPLGEVLQQPDVSPAYATNTLPRALRALGLSDAQIAELLGS